MNHPPTPPTPSGPAGPRPRGRRESHASHETSEPALSIRDFQQHIRERYHAADHARGTPGTFMWLIEEVGELATTLHKVRGEGGATSGGSTAGDLADEFADVFAWLCTLANINDVDLTAAVRAKYLTDQGPAGHK